MEFKVAVKQGPGHPQFLHTHVLHNGSQLFGISNQNNLEGTWEVPGVKTSKNLRRTVLSDKVVWELEVVESLTFSGRLQTSGIIVCGSVVIAHSSTTT